MSRRASPHPLIFSRKHFEQEMKAGRLTRTPSAKALRSLT